jgi:hypothetical protein
MSRGDWVFNYISDFWLRLKERNLLALTWDAQLRQTSNLYLQAYNVDLAKSLFRVPELFRSEWVTFRFDDTTLTRMPDDAPTGFNYAYSINPNIFRIDKLTEHGDPTGEVRDDGGETLYDEVDFVVLGGLGIILFVEEAPFQYMFSNSVFRDEEVIFNNFGFLVDYERPPEFDQQLYLAQVQGLFTALWLGGTLENIELGVHVLLGFPFMTPGIVNDVQLLGDGSYLVNVTDAFGTRDIEVPANLAPVTVTAGETVTRYLPLGSGIIVEDYVDDLDFMLNLVDIGYLELPQIYFTFAVIMTQEALTEAQVIFGEDFASRVVGVIENFIDRIKPVYTDWKFSPQTSFDEEFELDDGIPDEFVRNIFRGLTSTVLENSHNVFGPTTPDWEMDEEVIKLRDELDIVVTGT